MNHLLDAVSLKLEASGPGQGRLELNGQDISRFVRDVTVRFPVGEVATATIEVLPQQGFSLNLPVAVNLTLLSLPGYVVHETTHPDGTRSWRAVPEEAV